jgi:hypothetical protein
MKEITNNLNAFRADATEAEKATVEGTNKITPKQVEALRRLVSSSEMLGLVNKFRHGTNYIDAGNDYKNLQDFLIEQVQRIINNP